MKPICRREKLDAKTRSLAKLSCALLALAFGCATPNIPQDPGIWTAKSTRFGIVLVVPPKAATYHDGQQGLIDIAINNAMSSDMDKRLQRLSPAAFTRLAGDIEERLQRLGFPTKRIEQPIALDDYPKQESGSANVYERDLAALFRYLDVDQLVLISIRAWGTSRPYYGFIPLGPPKAFCRGSGNLVARDGHVGWRLTDTGLESVVAIAGEWDEPPAFPAVTDAVLGAQSTAARLVYASFFEHAPQARRRAATATPSSPVTPAAPAPTAELGATAPATPAPAVAPAVTPSSVSPAPSAPSPDTSARPEN